MEVNVCKSATELGRKAASYTAQLLNEAIERSGYARLLLSTGASQFETLEALVKQTVDWKKVEMFHLDEYVHLSPSHPASFRKYLKERFVDLVPLKGVHFVNGEGDVQAIIRDLTNELRKAPIDVGLVGIGENAHIAFNDPPADFDTEEAFIVVDLDDACKRQQVGEGWFTTIDDVPNQAISMTVHQIMQCAAIVSCVPNKRKADAIRLTVEGESVTPSVPSSILKTHRNWTLFLDRESASGVDQTKWNAAQLRKFG